MLHTAISDGRFALLRTTKSLHIPSAHLGCLRRPSVVFHSELQGSRSFFTIKPALRWPRKTTIVVASGTVFSGLVAFGLFSDGPTHALLAFQRSMRVATALALCIRDYQKTLSSRSEEPDQDELSACHQRCADRTLKVLERNGSVFLKLGQHLSSLSYLLPREWVVTFIPLQDKCPISSLESLEAMVLQDTGQSIDELFEEFDIRPIGAASLAQVHRARLRANGKEVAVKLQHPSLKEWIPIDLALTRFVATNINFFFPEYPLGWLSDELEESLPNELDFENEAENIKRVQKHFGPPGKLPLVIPDVIWATKRILVMEYIRGHRLDDLNYLDRNSISRSAVSESLAHIFCEMIFGRDAPLHCDAHGGNLAIRKTSASKLFNFEIILYDHGLYRDIPIKLKRSYAKLWLAIIDGNESKMRRYAYEVCGVTDSQFPLFASAITGREYHALRTSVASPRTKTEKQNISDALTDGLLAQLVQLLSQVPRIILLILKTNDLTRSLDENLCTGKGPERNFMIMARHCGRAVYEERIEDISQTGSWWNARAIYAYVAATCSLLRLNLKLTLLGFYLSIWGTSFA